MRISGTVQKGQQRARAFGYPTANIALDSFSEKPGTYAARATIDHHSYPAAAYISHRIGAWMCEVHVLDIDKDLYDQWIDVDLLAHISSIDPFESVQQMQNKIHEDMRDVRSYHHL